MDSAVSDPTWFLHQTMRNTKQERQLPARQAALITETSLPEGQSAARR